VWALPAVRSDFILLGVAGGKIAYRQEHLSPSRVCVVFPFRSIFGFGLDLDILILKIGVLLKDLRKIKMK
jgi:hypothetical protein